MTVNKSRFGENYYDNLIEQLKTGPNQLSTAAKQVYQLR